MNSDTHEPQSQPRSWPLPLLIAAISLVAVVGWLDSSGAVPQLGEGPGLTLDETFNVQMGVYHVIAIKEYGLALFHPDSVREVFAHPAYNPDHPPLGRLLLGLAHEATLPWLKPDVARGQVCVTCGRFGAALAYAATILLIGTVTSRWYGRAAGVIASLSMVLMPRLFAHAHIASLETCVNLTYLATILWVASRWNIERPPAWRDVLIAGVLFGLCLLTKIQAVLLPIPIGLWSLWRWRARAILPMCVFGLIGFAVFFVGWPWLWLDPIEHLREYFGRTTDRQTIYCWYLDRKWADTDVPWHYALVMFAVTVPIGLHLLGGIGTIARQSNRESTGTGDNTASKLENAPSPVSPPTGFLFLNVLWPLLFFALPRITVYDGTRLFLMVFPLWAILIGCGGATLMEWIQVKTGRALAISIVALLLACQGYGLIRMHPLGLSYYNALTGGLGGAVTLGFEATYWGDSVTRSLLDDAAQSAGRQGELLVAPVLHPFQLSEMRAQSPALREQQITLRAYDDQAGDDAGTVLVFRRRADSWASLTPQPSGDLVDEVTREGVQLSAVYEVPQ